MIPTLTIEPDWGGGPIWVVGDPNEPSPYGDKTSERDAWLAETADVRRVVKTLGDRVPKEIADDLDSWQTEWQEVDLDDEDPQKQWWDRGLALARSLQSALAPEFVVLYFNVPLDEVSESDRHEYFAD